MVFVASWNVTVPGPDTTLHVVVSARGKLSGSNALPASVTLAPSGQLVTIPAPGLTCGGQLMRTLTTAEVAVAPNSSYATAVK